MSTIDTMSSPGMNRDPGVFEPLSVPTLSRLKSIAANDFAAVTRGGGFLGGPKCRVVVGSYRIEV